MPIAMGTSAPVTPYRTSGHQSAAAAATDRTGYPRQPEGGHRNECGARRTTSAGGARAARCVGIARRSRRTRPANRSPGATGINLGMSSGWIGSVGPTPNGLSIEGQKNSGPGVTDGITTARKPKVTAVMTTSAVLRAVCQRLWVDEDEHEAQDARDKPRELVQPGGLGQASAPRTGSGRERPGGAGDPDRVGQPDPEQEPGDEVARQAGDDEERRPWRR